MSNQASQLKRWTGSSKRAMYVTRAQTKARLLLKDLCVNNLSQPLAFPPSINISSNSRHRYSAIAFLRLLKMSLPNVSNVALWFALALVFGTLFSKLHQAYSSPLRDVQGPWLARFTRFWYARSTYSRQGHKINMDLHKKYGSIVRIAPNEYSIDDLEASKIIYRSRDPLIKVC